MKLFKILPVAFATLPFMGITQIQYNPAIERSIDSLFNEYKNEPGAAAAIVHNGEVIYQKGFGLANLENGDKVTPQTVFETGCVAMNFTATAILLLENEGKLSLDDPIRKYLTAFPEYKKGEVTIRHCIHHTSGFRDYLDLIEMRGEGLHIDFDNTAGLNLLKNQKELTIVPGSDYRYSHSNYLVLALIIEEISGISMAEFADKNIFSPLEMKNTFFYEDKEGEVKNQALLYGLEDEKFQLKQNYDFTACGDGRLYTTVEDMTKWMANFNSSKLGGDERFMEKLYSKGVLNNGNEMSYAFGLEHAVVNGRKELGHNGWFGGANAMFLLVPDENLSVITMGSNIERSTIWKPVYINSLLFDDENYVAKIDSPDVIEKEISISKKERREHCGAYFSYAFGYDYRIYEKDDALYFHDGEYADALLKPIGENLFRIMAGSNSTTIEFGTLNGKKTLSLRFGERPPIVLINFQPLDSSDKNEWLANFTGKYYSEELELTYELRIDNDKLNFFVGEKQIVAYEPLMDGLFSSQHDGYLVFEKGKNEEFNRFTINDYSLGKLSFVRQ